MKPEKVLINRLQELGELLVDEPMHLHTTFKTGGPADLLFYPRDVDSLSDALRLCREYDIPVQLAGGGSNLLVGDGGIRGMVIVCAEDRPLSGNMRITETGLVYADATVRKRSFLSFCMENGLEGMEFLAGIPGCLGGGIIMNAGTTMGTFAGILERVEYLSSDGEQGYRMIDAGMARYRHLDIGRGMCITGAFYRLGKTGDPAAVQMRVKAAVEERKAKHPLDYPSAGSVFKNPDGAYSWKLINDAGLRGYRLGGAMVSELHTNFIINYDNASSRDIKSLVEYVQNRVKEEFGVFLEPEIRMIGDF